MMPAKLDRFELVAELASGGMGTVFLARLGGAGGFQRLYAIKRLHEHLARHTEFIEMFLDEARLAARIHHPNVVPILEIGTSDEGYYLVMEYVEGDTAGHLFHSAAKENKVIPPGVSIRIILDVLAGLHAAHEGTDDQGQLLEVVHRDVSPHNILVSVDGVSRITDFGIARAASRLAVTRTGQLKGKVAYMAPEQARSEKIDRRADVFATGICLWEMLAGQRLFKVEGEGDTLNRLLYEPIPSLRSVAPAMAPEIDAVCAKALTRDLAQRFATAADFSDALESAARAADCLATHREVAACIADVLDDDLSERRADLRAWLADTERRSLLPPAPSSRDLIERPRGAHVSVHVPPLFDAGPLGPHAEADRRGGRRSGGRRVGIIAVALAISLGVGTWWHRRTPAAVAAVASPQAVAAVASPQAVTAVASPHAQAEPVAFIAPESAPADVAAAPTPPVGSSAAALSAAASSGHGSVEAGSRTTVVAVMHTPHTSSTPSQVRDAATAHPAASVPREMLYNPYR